MYCPLPGIDDPADATVIWRYMDLAKFLSLLTSSSLYLTRIDKLIDQFEARWPPSALVHAERNWSAANFDSFKRTSDAMRAAHFVSCWCASDSESSGLWHQYAVQGVAIESSVGALKTSSKGQYRFYLGRVTYTRLEEVTPAKINHFSNAYLKRIEYAAESELRLLVSSLGPGQEQPSYLGALSHIRFGVRLHELIRRVVLAPQAPEHLFDSLKSLLENLALGDIALERSALYA